MLFEPIAQQRCKSLEFDGYDHLEVSADSSFDFTGAFGVAAWVRPEQISSPEPVALHEWTHVAGSLGAGELTLYLNGVTAKQERCDVPPASSGGALSIGKFVVSDSQYIFGAIDDVYLVPASAASFPPGGLRAPLRRSRRAPAPVSHRRPSLRSEPRSSMEQVEPGAGVA